MRVILSRKGFDSSIGGYPSPIINGTPLSFPIPDSKDKIKYSNLKFNGKSYLEIMRGLGIKKFDENSTCHLDPDLRFDILDNRICPNDWKGSLGQVSQAQRHLENQGVGIGDLFLFFGWFKETENKDGKIIYKRNLKYPDGFHLIYGYLRIGEIIKPQPKNALLGFLITLTIAERTSEGISLMQFTLREKNLPKRRIKPNSVSSLFRISLSLPRLVKVNPAGIKKS